MLERKAIERFRQWADDPSASKALLVTGARQVGKTFLVEKFASERFENVASFNLVENVGALRSFSQAADADDLALRISVASAVPLVAGKTVVFIDEVQECPNIITLVKFLVQKGDYRYILSGSLLGIALEKTRSVPVGYLAEVEMFPLDFEEFCWSQGLAADAFAMAHECFESRAAVPDFLHERLMGLFHRYLLVGGMPDAVNAFAASNNIDNVRTAQDNIRQFYRYDIGKYARRERRLVIQNIYDLIPSELSSKTRRFRLSSVENVKRFNQVEDEFLWLTNAGVALAAYNITAPVRPLLLSETRSKFKLFCNDVGLLTSTFLKQTTIDLLDGRSGMNLGGVYENFVAQELRAHGFSLHYYAPSKVGELDFVVERRDGQVIAIEVKSGGQYRRHAALDNALRAKGFGIDRALVLAEVNVEQDGEVTYLPSYMTVFLTNQ